MIPLAPVRPVNSIKLGDYLAQNYVQHSDLATRRVIYTLIK